MICDKEICKKQLIYGKIYRRAKRCVLHRKEGDINCVRKRCDYKNCKNMAIYNIKNNPKCRRHRAELETLPKLERMPKLKKQRVIKTKKIIIEPEIENIPVITMDSGYISDYENEDVDITPDFVSLSSKEDMYIGYFDDENNKCDLINNKTKLILKSFSISKGIISPLVSNNSSPML
jgi:hypothetical protein